jgi:hypothetical protein
MLRVILCFKRLCFGQLKLFILQKTLLGNAQVIYTSETLLGVDTPEVICNSGDSAG